MKEPIATPMRARQTIVTALALVTLAMSIAAAAAPAPYSRGLLFRLDRPGVAPSYVFGTLHSNDPRVVGLPEPVRAAFGLRFAAAFLGADFLAGAFLAGTFLVADFLAEGFLAGFFAAGFLAGFLAAFLAVAMVLLPVSWCERTRLKYP